MCGISGIVGRIVPGAIEAMTSALAHRGPDDTGYWTDTAAGVALGQRRLSIIDLSSAGHQPMASPDGRYWITFNGEIYNFRELREELAQAGATFRSSSDTEVLLHSYARWGEGCLARLRGMFAFGLWDRESRSLFLARDRFGIKPLVYAERGGTLLFASEVKALLASGLLSAQADPQALWSYVAFGSVPQPATILKGAWMLLPGHVLRWHDGHVTTSRYWDIEERTRAARADAARLRYEDAVDQLRVLLDDATRAHLISDVPVGAFLSGGVDSTAVVGLMNRLVDHPIRTYALGAAADGRAASELPWASLAAQRLGTDHTEVVLDGDTVARGFDSLIDALDQPSADGANTFFVSRATRAGVTVALSGLGGDELLAGYPHFRQLDSLGRRLPRGLPLLRPLLQHACAVLPGRMSAPLARAIDSPLQRVAAIRRLVSDPVRQAIVSRSLRAHLAEAEPSDARYAPWLRPGLDSTTQVSYLELNTYLRDTLLRDADAMSMAHALEVRPVLLDHRLAEFVFALPSSFKMTGEGGKRIFLDALRDVLPPEIVGRPKRGFDLPLASWLATSLRERALAAFDSPTARAVFDARWLKQLTAPIRTGAQPHWRSWAYLVLIECLTRRRLEVPGSS